MRKFNGPVCGYKKRDGSGHCQQKAGHGTTHLGIGRCSSHEASHTVKKSAIRKEAIQFMGAPKTINPFEAIIWCIRITAGEVEWLSQQIARIDDEDQWIEHTPLGKQMHVMQRTRADAQDRLVRYSRDAIQLGLAERAIRLAETYGQQIARLLEGIGAELGLTTAQKKEWPKIVRRQLIMLEGGHNEEGYEWEFAPMPEKRHLAQR